MGASDVRHRARYDGPPRLQYRRIPPHGRTDAAASVPPCDLLRTLAVRVRKLADRKGRRRAHRNRRPDGGAARRRVATDGATLHTGSSDSRSGTRRRLERALDEAWRRRALIALRSEFPPAFQRGRSCTRAQSESGGPHAESTLRLWPSWDLSSRLGSVRFPGHKCAWLMYQAAALLRSRIRGALPLVRRSSG